MPWCIIDDVPEAEALNPCFHGAFANQASSTGGYECGQQGFGSWHVDIFGDSKVVTELRKADETSCIVIKGGQKDRISHDEPASNNGMSREWAGGFVESGDAIQCEPTSETVGGQDNGLEVIWSCNL